MQFEMDGVTADVQDDGTVALTLTAPSFIGLAPMATSLLAGLGEAEAADRRSAKVVPFLPRGTTGALSLAIYRGGRVEAVLGARSPAELRAVLRTVAGIGGL
jgi:hypothetical protein